MCMSCSARYHAWMLQGDFLLFNHSFIVLSRTKQLQELIVVLYVKKKSINSLYWLLLTVISCMKMLKHNVLYMCLSDAAALVLTLCCGAKWTSCCSSSRLLLLFSLLLKTASVSPSRALSLLTPQQSPL